MVMPIESSRHRSVRLLRASLNSLSSLSDLNALMKVTSFSEIRTSRQDMVTMNKSKMLKVS